MRRSRFLFYVAVVLGLLIPLSAEAAPYGASYVPNPLSCLTPNQVKTHPISLTNTGTNTWTIQRPGGYHLSYHWYQGANQVVWEGDRTYLPNQVNPNQSVALQANLKAPAALGTYTLTWDMVHENVAWFSSQGVATGNQTVEVKSSCLTFGPFIGPPKIEQVVPFVSNITPGGSAVIKGSWFGNDEGDLYLKGLKKWNGVALSPIKLTIATEPGKDFWKPTGVIGFIPGNITEVKDQPATLQIKTKAGKLSNEYPVNFAAKKDTKQLPAGDVQVSCSDEADLDSCNNVVHSDSIPFCSAPFVSGGGGTFSGYHWTCVGSSNGTDSFSASLKHDWRFEHAALADLSGSVFQTVTMSGFQSGATSTNVKLKWNNSNVSYVLYKVNVSIIGPKGVPHK
jgi:hypothetical protein